MTLHPADDESPYDEAGPEQDRIRSLLGNLPDPGPMPEDLVQRIQSRLADEALQVGLREPHGSHGVVDLDARRRMRRMGTLAGLGGAAAAAAVVGVLLTGGLDKAGPSVNAFEGPSTSSSASAASSPAAGDAAAPRLELRLSDTNVTTDTLDSTASALLTTAGRPLDAGAAESPTLGPLATEKGMTGCLATLGIRDYEHVSAQIGRFELKPAVVLGVRTRSGELQAWVVDRACTELMPHHVIS